MDKVKLGTIWLDACSGCHMSLLDLDERLVGLADRIEMVYGPLVDAKEIPSETDVFLITGSVSTDKEIEKVRAIRQSSRIVAAFGDCAVTGNVPSMRNYEGAKAALNKAYCTEESGCRDIPGLGGSGTALPRLLERVRPVHEVIDVDQYIQGCPPGADLIHMILGELLEGRTPRRGIRTHFG